MFFTDYSEFLQPEPDVIRSKPYKNDQVYYQNPSYLVSPAIIQHDLVYSQFTQTISKRLLAQPYPTNYQNFNPFCPLCLKFVENGSLFITCFLNHERNYLIHQQCLIKHKGYQTRNVGQMLQNTISCELSIPDTERKFYYGLDYRCFYLQIGLCHPINDINFVKINRKINLARDKFTIDIDEKSSDEYVPNVIMMPLTDVHLNVLIQQIGNKDNRSKLTNYISIRNLKERNKMVIKHKQFSLEVEIIDNMDEKKRLVNLMNYKYMYPLDLPVPLLRIHKFIINLPEEFQESEGEQYCTGGRSNIVEQLLNERQTPSTLMTPEPIAKHKFCLVQTEGTYGGALGDPEKINLPKLISTHTLVEFVKNNVQSRVFQDFLSVCPSSDIQLIIAHTKPSMAQLIMHEYGNYMIQKLFTVCTPLQRLQILQTIAPRLAELIKNKQGTHTIQAFIDHFTTNEQFALITLQMRQEYYDLCKNSNSTHFIQKVVKIFPLAFMLPFFEYTVQNLLAFALDKNAMCVIKHMMRRLRELEGKAQQNDQVIDIIRRQLIANVTFSVDMLIIDGFGNYVIQFCYELYDLQKCSGITQRILSRFANYAVGKFSSNVLLKCISTYWTDKRVYHSLKYITSSQVIEIFRNKDGNKILLEVMERLDGSDLWDRLYGILIQVQPTKFYHDRWGVCLGSRSGQVGSRLRNFPQVRKKQYIKKGNLHQ